MPDAPPPSNLTQVAISTETLNVLRKIADRQNISLSEALQQAVHVSQLLVDAENDDDTHVLLKQGRRVQELKLVSGKDGGRPQK